MTGVTRDGETLAPNAAVKSVRIVDEKVIGDDGLQVNFNLEAHCDSNDDDQGKSAFKSFASIVNDQTTQKKVHFRVLETGQPSVENADVQIPMSSVMEANSRFENTLYGYFIGKRVAFPVVEHYVLNAWKKYGINKAMMNAKGFFFFKFNSATCRDQVLENGPWFIRNVPIVLKKWSSTASLLKEDLASVPIWVKLHDVPIAAFTSDGLSAIGTKLGTPLMLDSYTSNMCMNSWGRLDFARALIDIRADRAFRETLLIAIPCVDGTSTTLHKIRVEYEWKPPRCGNCMVFGHADVECPKRILDNLKKQVAAKVGTDGKKQADAQGFQVPRKPFRGLVIGNPKKVAVANPKQVFVAKKKAKETSTTTTSNSFEALNKLDTKLDSIASPSEKVVNQKNDHGKKVASTDDSTDKNSSLFSRWKSVYGSNVTNSYMAGQDEEDDEDDILDPVDSEMADYMSLHDRKMDKKN